MIEAEPQRGRGRELGVAAADPAAGEEAEGDDENDRSRRRHATAMSPAGSCPVATASTKKPPARISDTRLEIVMVRRSLEAANAISAGNSISLIASATMTRDPSASSAWRRDRSRQS